jgi:hypothetical protein
MARGNGRQEIARDDDDRRKWEDLVSEMASRRLVLSAFFCEIRRTTSIDLTDEKEGFQS